MQEYWSGLPCPPPGDLPNPEIELASPTLPADLCVCVCVCGSICDGILAILILLTILGG